MILKKKKEQIISFISMLPYLNSIEETLPKPSKNFIPDWWKKTPLIPSQHSLNSLTIGNVKNCPSFPDYFSQGFTIPMWADTLLVYDDVLQSYRWQTAHNDFFWDAHSHEQFLNDVPATSYGLKGSFIFKAICPWRIVTKPGYSVLQLPMLYHFEREYSVLPGVIDTDIHHEINQQTMIFPKNKEIFIKRGEPFVTYIPFKRSSFSYDVRAATEEDTNYQNKIDYFIRTKFSGTKQYNAKRKIRDKQDE